MKKTKNRKKVYIGLSIDILHHGHINLINKAKKYGDLIIGLYTDKAIVQKKRLPLKWIEKIFDTYFSHCIFSTNYFSHHLNEINTTYFCLSFPIIHLRV